MAAHTLVRSTSLDWARARLAARASGAPTAARSSARRERKLRMVRVSATLHRGWPVGADTCGWTESVADTLITRESRMVTAARIAVIPGDGIGQEVVPEGLRVLDRVSGGRLSYTHFPW